MHNSLNKKKTFESKQTNLRTSNEMNTTVKLNKKYEKAKESSRDKRATKTEEEKEEK